MAPIAGNIIFQKLQKQKQNMDDILKKIKYEHDSVFKEEKEDKFPPEFINENQKPPDWY